MSAYCRKSTCAGRLTLLSASAAMRAGDGGFGAGDGERDVERDENSESLLAADLCALPAHATAACQLQLTVIILFGSH